METEEIFDKVKEIIVEQLGVAENTVNLVQMIQVQTLQTQQS